MNNKKKIILGVIVGVLVLTLAGTFALWAYSKIGQNQLVVAGDIYMKYTGTNNLNVTNAMPSDTYNEKDKFEFTIEGKNTYSKDVWYEIVINRGKESEDRTNRLDDKYLKFRLTETKENSDEEVVVEEGSYEDFSTGKSIWVNTIAANTLDQTSIKYKLYVWISNETLIGNTEGAIPMEEWNDTYASIKVTVNGDFEEKYPDGEGEDPNVQLAVEPDKVALNGSTKIKITSAVEGKFAVTSDSDIIALASVKPEQGTETTLTIEGKEIGNTNINLSFTPIVKGYKRVNLTYNVEVEKTAAEQLKETLGTGGIIGVTTNNELTTDKEASDIREYRYSGAEVNNYVYFNCSDSENEQNSSNCETWRIIGIFKDDAGEEHMKIVRNSTLTTMKWDSSSSCTESNYTNCNQSWTSSTAAVRTYLNGSYLTSLTSKAQNMIYEEAKWYLGKVTYNATIAELYTQERSTSDNSPWPGKIGLMYPSDYGFASDSSNWSKKSASDYSTYITTNWLFKDANHTTNEFFLSPTESDSHNVADWGSGGIVGSHKTYNSYDVRPTIYLKSTIQITGNNDGSSSSPYMLSVE